MSGTKTITALLLLIAGSLRADPAAWHVQADNGSQLWLLGSVHYLRPQDYPLPPIVDELYSQADALVMELDLDDLDPVATQAQFLGAAMLEPRRNLQQVLGEQTYQAAAAASQDLGFDLSLMAQFEPWLVAITLLDLGMVQLGFRPEHGLEQHLLRMAGEDAKPVLGLEELSAQINVFDGLTDSEQRALLTQTLVELQTPGARMTELVNAWREGRLDAMAGALMQDFDAFPELYNALVVERNRSWISVLRDLLAEPTDHLVIVGALHLVGKDSVIDLLRSGGLKVTPVGQR